MNTSLTHFTPEQRRRIVARHRDGVSMRNIGASFGVGAGVICRVLREEQEREQREEVRP